MWTLIIVLVLLVAWSGGGGLGWAGYNGFYGPRIAPGYAGGGGGLIHLVLVLALVVFLLRVLGIATF